MAIVQGRGRRSARGSRYKTARGYRKSELGRLPTNTGLGDRRVRPVRMRGGHSKHMLLSEQFANVVDPKTLKCQKVKIKTISGNPANRHFVRRNIITKGAILETDIGKARVTGRPGQDAAINAVLIS